MNTKSVLVTVFILLLTLTLVEISLVDVASANFMPLNVPAHNIEITADGNVTGTDNIERNGTVYTFRGNISGSIVVLCDGITINGNGYTLQENGYPTGIFLEGRKMVTIKNMTITNFKDGVVYSDYQGWNDDCRDNVLSENNITNNEYGVYCYIPRNITISRNTISNNNKTGVSSFLTEGLLIYGNTLSGNGAGVRFTDCDNNNVCGNNFINNTSQTTLDPESKSGLNFGWSTVNWHDGNLGNFWSDYTGLDANHDGIGDTPYVIDANNTDNYPVMASIDISHIPNTPPSPTPTASPSPSPTVSTSPASSPSPIVETVSPLSFPTLLLLGTISVIAAVVVTITVIVKKKT
jgi:parallel beta-helix repeat protein